MAAGIELNPRTHKAAAFFGSLVGYYLGYLLVPNMAASVEYLRITASILPAIVGGFAGRDISKLVTGFLDTPNRSRAIADLATTALTTTALYLAVSLGPVTSGVWDTIWNSVGLLGTAPKLLAQVVAAGMLAGRSRNILNGLQDFWHSEGSLPEKLLRAPEKLWVFAIPPILSLLPQFPNLYDALGGGLVSNTTLVILGTIGAAFKTNRLVSTVPARLKSFAGSFGGTTLSTVGSQIRRAILPNRSEHAADRVGLPVGVRDLDARARDQLAKRLHGLADDVSKITDPQPRQTPAVILLSRFRALLASRAVATPPIGPTTPAPAPQVEWSGPGGMAHRPVIVAPTDTDLDAGQAADGVTDAASAGDSFPSGAPNGSAGRARDTQRPTVRGALRGLALMMGAEEVPAEGQSNGR